MMTRITSMYDFIEKTKKDDRYKLLLMYLFFMRNNYSFGSPAISLMNDSLESYKESLKWLERWVESYKSCRIFTDYINESIKKYETEVEGFYMNHFNEIKKEKL